MSRHLKTVAAVLVGRLEAAERILNALTTWLREHPDCTYIMTIDPSTGCFRFQIVTPDQTHVFGGTSAQDAQAQAAQAIVLEEI